jgi:hypothetical protein
VSATPTWTLNPCLLSSSANQATAWRSS